MVDVGAGVNEKHEKRPSNVIWIARIDLGLPAAVETAERMMRVAEFLPYLVCRQLHVLDDLHGPPQHRSHLPALPPTIQRMIGPIAEEHLGTSGVSIHSDGHHQQRAERLVRNALVNGRRSSLGPCNSKGEVVDWLNGELASAANRLDNDFNLWRISPVEGMAAL